MNSEILSFAIKAHHDTNHTYDGAPYSLHLSMVVSYAYEYLHLIPEQYREDVIHACWLHDTIEDTRKSYNDIKKVAGEKVADIVFAVTNDKGKTRSERAGDTYYKGIRDTPYAGFVKLCDRLANAKYSADTNSRMQNVYREENSHFLESIFDTNITLYESTVSELKQILQLNGTTD